MTDAPTTRADHAELARLRQHIANLKLRPGHHVQFGTPSVSQISNYWNRDLAADLENLLSEIAALRGEVERLSERLTPSAFGALRDRATQAERQRDEAMAVLIDIRDVPYTEQEWPRSRALNFIANQGAE